MIRRLVVAAMAALPVFVLSASPADAAAAPTVTGIEVRSLHPLPSPRPEAFLTDLVGQPLDRARIRESLDRIWALGIFDSLEVEAVPQPGGVLLRYQVARRPHVERVDWSGDLGLAAADLAGNAALALGGPGDPDRLERARREVLGRLQREGYLGATVALDVKEDPATNGRAVTFVVHAGEQARVGSIEIVGFTRADPTRLLEALGLREGDRFRERAYRDGVRALEENLHEQGFFEARVTARDPVWSQASNRVVLTVQGGRPCPRRPCASA
jgi:outer membrane protein assembly factor BamA